MNNSLGEQLRASAGDAIDMTIERQCRLHPELRQRFGERGLKHWREDIGHHIAYLRAAIDSGRNQPFADYLAQTVTATLGQTRTFARSGVAPDMPQHAVPHVLLGDVAPTLLGLAGLPVPKEMTGRDLRG